jgi:arylformamidase
VYIPPVQQAAPAQPVYSSTPQNEQIAPQEPVYTPPQEAEQPAYQTPAPAPQPVYIPPMPQPVQQTAPIILPPLDGPYKPDRKKAKAHKNDQQTAGPVQGAGNGPWIDVSAPLAPAVTPVYEGNPPLVVKFTMDMENGDALDLSQIDMGTHTGTHVDAPLHFVRGAPSIDEVPLDRLIGPALVIDVDPRVIAITAAELEKYPWRGHQRVLFRTRNSVNSWIIDPHFHRDFTFLAPDAAQLLADNGVLLVGIDYLSIEQFGAYKPRTHQILLGRGIPIVEGLDLRTVIPGEYDFIVMPLKILGHEAAPARAALRAR